MKSITRLMVCACLTMCANSNHAFGQTVSPVQSPARPFKLPIIGPVYQAASDDRSTHFHQNEMQIFLQIIQQHLAESAEFVGRSGFKLDGSKLLLRTESDETIRIYFLAEGAGYHNTVGFAWTMAGSPTKGEPKILFPDASMRKDSTRTEWEPLKVGDFVDIGLGARALQIDFFLISNAVNGGKHWLWNDAAANPDGLQHMVAFLLPGSRYVLLGFEDIIGGGDLDYNDSLFVIDIGEVNAQNLMNDASTLPH